VQTFYFLGFVLLRNGSLHTLPLTIQATDMIHAEAAAMQQCEDEARIKYGKRVMMVTVQQAVFVGE